MIQLEIAVWKCINKILWTLFNHKVNDGSSIATCIKMNSFRTTFPLKSLNNETGRQCDQMEAEPCQLMLLMRICPVLPSLLIENLMNKPDLAIALKKPSKCVCNAKVVPNPLGTT